MSQQPCSALKSLKSKVTWLTHWLTDWLTDWQGHLLSCPGQLKIFALCFNCNQLTGNCFNVTWAMSILWWRIWKSSRSPSFLRNFWIIVNILLWCDVTTLKRSSLQCVVWLGPLLSWHSQKPSNHACWKWICSNVKMFHHYSRGGYRLTKVNFVHVYPQIPLLWSNISLWSKTLYSFFEEKKTLQTAKLLFDPPH